MLGKTLYLKAKISPATSNQPVVNKLEFEREDSGRVKDKKRSVIKLGRSHRVSTRRRVIVGGSSPDDVQV